MRAGIVAIFFFAGLLALGHYVAAPFFCRGELAIPTLDPRALCGADLHFNRSGSVLLYFASIAGALFFGIVGGLLPGRSRKTVEEKKPETSAAATFEQIVAEEEKKQQSAQTTDAGATQTQGEAPKIGSEAAAPVATEAATPPAEVPGPSHSAAAAAQAAIVDAIFAPAAPKPAPAATPAPAPVQPAATSTETTAKAEAITVGLAVKKSAAHGPFDGTNQELLERFRELKKNENVNSIAQAQRLLDESTLNALGKGIDPKQHLSDVAHLVLTEDPDLKSGVVRGVVVHIAARLKELGVVQKIPNPAKPAA